MGSGHGGATPQVAPGRHALGSVNDTTSENGARWPLTATPIARPEADRRLYDATLLAGLAGVFLVGADRRRAPDVGDFPGLVGRSLLGRVLPALGGNWMAWVIGINDGALGLFLMAAIWSRRARPLALAWAGGWLLAVTIIKMTSLHTFGG